MDNAHPIESLMFNASPTWRIRAATLLGLLAGLPFAAQAQVYKCPQAGGSISYQSTPCTTDAPPSARPTAAQLNAARRARLAAEAASANKPAVDATAKAAKSRLKASVPSKPSTTTSSPSTGRR